MGDLGAGDEDGPCGEVHAQVAERGRAEGVVKDAPQRDLNQNSAQAVVHLVPADASADKKIHDHALHSELDHSANEDSRQGQCLHPSRQLVGDPDVLHIHISLGVSILIRAHVVADDMLIVPAHGWPNQEEAGKEAQAVDPLMLANLVVATLVRESSAHSSHNASGE